MTKKMISSNKDDLMIHLIIKVYQLKDTFDGH